MPFIHVCVTLAKTDGFLASIGRANVATGFELSKPLFREQFERIVAFECEFPAHV